MGDALYTAFEGLVQALPLSGRDDTDDTATRAAQLWRDRLLAGHAVQLGDTLGERFEAGPSPSAVCLRGVSVHLVCPHHLTVAFGKCDLAYAPGRHIVGFGGLVRLIEAACFRMVLQEEAGGTVAATLVDAIGAEAAVCRIEAQHPCHNLTHPRAHQSRVVTVNRAGDDGQSRALVSML